MTYRQLKEKLNKMKQRGLAQSISMGWHDDEIYPCSGFNFASDVLALQAADGDSTHSLTYKDFKDVVNKLPECALDDDIIMNVRGDNFDDYRTVASFRRAENTWADGIVDPECYVLFVEVPEIED